jgi:hypothetical protein
MQSFVFARWVGALPFEPYSQPFFCAGASLRPLFSYLRFLGSRDYS